MIWLAGNAASELGHAGVSLLFLGLRNGFLGIATGCASRGSHLVGMPSWAEEASSRCARPSVSFGREVSLRLLYGASLFTRGIVLGHERCCHAVEGMKLALRWVFGQDCVSNFCFCEMKMWKGDWYQALEVPAIKGVKEM